jgi:hypothetical protein
VANQRKLYNKYKKIGELYYQKLYAECRRNSKKQLREIHGDHLDKYLYNPLTSGDSKSFYRFMKAKTGSCNKIKSLIRTNSGEKLEVPELIANELNEFFESVFNPSEGGFHRLETASTSSNIKIEVEGVKHLINNLKPGKAPGPDGLRKHDLCMAVDEISEILALIFQYSLDTGFLPTIWKQANVTPIYKSGGKQSPSNYRPVSLTCICCKILEHIVLHSLSPDINKILIPNQHGFRKGLSCATQLLTTTQTLMKEVDEGGCIQAVILDFSKAFDKVSHHLLIGKLISFGFSNDIVNWIFDFLVGRRQRVVLQGAFFEIQKGNIWSTSGIRFGPGSVSFVYK